MQTKKNLLQKTFFKIQTELELASYYRNMQWMSESELQKAISYVDQPQIQKRKLKSILINKLPLQAAWLAAAQIARMRGYKLSAKLVECSIFNKNYSKTNVMFAKAIKKTKTKKKGHQTIIVFFYNGKQQGILESEYINFKCDKGKDSD